jgi:dephospho-CoA kinase
VFLIGLTGGIASGKSTVASLLQKKGARVIDADEVAREVVLPGTPGLEAVVKEFGSGILNADNSLARHTLGQIVFDDAEKRQKLEAILHPLISKRTKELISASDAQVVVYAVPLLVEAKVQYPFDMVVTVEAGEDNQIQRLISTRGLSEQEAKNRISSQASAKQRINRADVVIDSSGPIENLTPQVEKLWSEIHNTIAQRA